jgi:hypothetical protein
VSSFGTIEIVQWSKLRSTVKSLICEELRARVDFHVTGYHSRRSTRARSGEITVDGKPVLELSYDRFCRESDGWFASVRGGQKWGVWVSPSSAETVWSEHQSDEIHPPQLLGDAMRAYLAMPVDEALTSVNPFIRALAIIDRRVGRRRLEGLEIGERDHSLVREFYRLRTEALASKRD